MNRQNRWNSGRDNSPYRDSRQEDDSHRGAYRLDTNGNRRNQSTFEGFRRENEAHRQSPDYNRNYNQDYNRNYNRDYNDDRHSGQGRRQNQEYGNRMHDSQYGDRYNDQYRGQEQDRDSQHSYGRSQQQHRSVHDRITDDDPYGTGNFTADYRPDRYGNGGGPNYGNMAGSLSFGYDGSNVSDPDWNSRYEPISGQRRSYHGNYDSRHPEFQRFRDKDERNQRSEGNDWY